MEIVRLGGYLKDLAGWYENPGQFFPADVGKVQNSLEDRLNLEVVPAAGLTLGAGLWSRFIYQRDFNAGGAYLAQLGNRDALADLDFTPVNDRDALVLASLDRLWIDWSTGPFQLTAGRQRIAWGTCLVWNPTDVFNPYSVLDFDYEERPGTDAVRLQYFTGPLSKIEIAAAPSREVGQSTLAGLFRLNASGYDVSFLGGVQRKAWFAGVNWAGQISGGGFRGEALYRRTAASRVILPLALAGWESPPPGRGYLALALSGDFTFPNRLYLHTEVLFNGEGVLSDAGSRWLSARQNGELAPARYSIYQECAYDVSPLVRATLFGIVNPSDGSSVIVPSVAWSVLTDWDVLCIALLAAGGAGTEYGDFGRSVFFRVKWSY